MANIHKRTFIVLMLISIITLGKVNFTDFGTGLLAHSYNSSHTKQDGGLSQTLGEELIFNYTDFFSESSLHFSCNNLNLTSYNELTINFLVQGDQSSKSGISVVFDINSTQIDFLIEKIHQHSTVYTLSRGFVFNNPIVADFNISVTFAGQATYGNSGALIILSNSSFTNLDIVNLAETEQALVVSPDILLFEGNMVGLREISTSVAFNNSFNSSYMVDLTIDFLVNDFQSYTNEMVLIIDAEEIFRSAFFENQANVINLQFEVESGFTFIELIFQIEICSAVIEISGISIAGKVVENTIGGESYYQFSWIDGINEIINLNPLKPYSENNEKILNISLFSSFEGTTVLDGIDYNLFFGATKIGSGIIPIVKQNGDIQLIQIITFTNSYQEDLTLQFSAIETGSGVITIYNTSTIVIHDITHVNTEIYNKILEESTTFITPSYGSVTKNYIDIIYIENASLPFQLQFLMEISSSGTSFQNIALTIYVDGVAVTAKSISKEGDVHIVLDVDLSEEYNEVKFVLNILGQGSTITMENVRYILQQSINSSQNPLAPEDEFNIPFFKVPKNIFLGIFVLFDCWLVMGIMLRIYKGRKLRKKQQVENDEFILEIAQLTQD